MGKLHKIRQAYNKLTLEEKESVKIYFTTGAQKGGFTENVQKLVKTGTTSLYGYSYPPYKYYFLSLLKKDGLIKREKWTKRISKLVSRNGNIYKF